jgi:guanylate kinase
MKDITGQVILLMAPSGSGKGRLVNSLGELTDSIYFAKTHTTRERRKGVKENTKYCFVTREEFEREVAEGSFIEWAEFSGNLYGTPKSEFIKPLEEGKVVLKEMELQGIQQIQKLVPKEHLTVVYIDAGDWDALKRRVLGRAPITPEELEMRRLRYIEELKAKSIADIVILNKDGYFENAAFAFKTLVQNVLKKVSE